MNKIDKDRLRAFRQQERDASRARLPLPDAEMEAFFEMLDTELSKVGCQHTRRLTDAWLEQRGHSTQQVRRWLDDNGGFCDCEALANAEEAWRLAAGRGDDE